MKRLVLSAAVLAGPAPAQDDCGDLPTKVSEGTSYGLAVVQTVEAIGTEVYLAVRSYEYDYEDATAVLIGARVRF